jgi:hypothetical protein
MILIYGHRFLYFNSSTNNILGHFFQGDKHYFYTGNTLAAKDEIDHATVDQGVIDYINRSCLT